jgi:tetratricopeptide (TPR) repeat protein
MPERFVEPFPFWPADFEPGDRHPLAPSVAWDPASDEQALRQALSFGDIECWATLTRLLRDQGRTAEIRELGERLATTASQKQLARFVELSASNFDAESGARFQFELISRFPADATALERCARLLAESGRYDQAMDVQREALRRGTDRRYFMINPRQTMRALTAATRFDDAEELMRAYADDMFAASPLALLLQVRGRTAEGEELLRRHPSANHLYLRFTLVTLLERDGRHTEAAAAGPAGGWPHQMRDAADRRLPADGPHEAIWSVTDYLGRAFAV